jgi:hypothetical protein
MKALWINSTDRTVTTVEYEDFRDMQKFVGGTFAGACRFENGDTLLVDDEGMYKDYETFFFVDGVGQPLAGNGLLTGSDHYDRATGEETTRDPVTTPAALLALLSFHTVEQVRAWGRANSSEVAASITSIRPDGRRETVVTSTWGKLLGVGPGKKGNES